MNFSLNKCLIVFFLAVLASSVVYAGSIESILNLKEEPAGVVFEVIESGDDEWDWITPKVENYTKQLRLRFPDLPVVIVSHGREQFMLLKSTTSENKQRHQALQLFMTNNDVELHVCAVHASWHENTPEDFVDFVNVAASSPAQINDYLKLGYKLIMLEENVRLEND